MSRWQRTKELTAKCGHVVHDALYNTATTLVSAPLSVFSPPRAARYRAERELYLHFKAAGRKVDKNWRPKNADADTLIKKDMTLVRARARALAEDNSNLGGALREIAKNVVYLGIEPQAQMKLSGGEADTTGNLTKEVKWKKWKRKTKLRQRCRQIVRSQFTDGGIFVNCFISPTLRKKGVVPLGFELLEVDHLDTALTRKRENGNIIRNGIEYSPDGFEVAYWLFTTHPGNSSPMLKSIGNRSKRFDAKWCLYVSQHERAAQSLPMPWLTHVVALLRDIDEYQNVERITARVAAHFGIFITSPNNTYAGNNPDGTPATGGAGSTPQAPVPKFLEPAEITQLPPGQDVKVTANPRPASNYEPFIRSSQNSASAGVGISSEAYSNDYKQASWSSGRLGQSKERRGYREIQNLLIEEFLDQLWELWILVGYLDGFWDDMEAEVSWQPPGWEYVDPKKDAEATEKLIEMGIDNPIDATARHGRNFEDNQKKIARAREITEQYGNNSQEQANETS